MFRFWTLCIVLAFEGARKSHPSSPRCHLVIIPAFILFYSLASDLFIPIERHLPRNRFCLRRISSSFTLIPPASSREILLCTCSSPPPTTRTNTLAPLPLLKSIRLQAQRSWYTMQFPEKATCVADRETVCVSAPEGRGLRVAVGAGKGGGGGVWSCFGILGKRCLGV